MPEQDNRYSSRRQGASAETQGASAETGLSKTIEKTQPTLESCNLPNFSRENYLEEINNNNSHQASVAMPTESFQIRFARQISEVREFVSSWINTFGTKNPHSIDPQSLSPHMRERALRMIDQMPSDLEEGIKQLKQALIDPHTTALAIYRDLRALAQAEKKGESGVNLANATSELNKRIREIPSSMHSEISSLINTALEHADLRGLDELGKSILLIMKSSLNLEPNLSLSA